MKNNIKKAWALYDARYIYAPDRAVCYEFCETLKEARKNSKDYGDGTIIVEHEVENNLIINSKIIE
jgi:predicted RNase H-like HicB family nuclease